MTRDPKVASFARKMSEYEDRIRSLEAALSGTDNLSRSSIEDGTVHAYDGDGYRRQSVGRTSDGTFALTYENGPQPSAPTGVSVAAHQLSIVAGWDGEFDSEKPPGDFLRVDFHMAKEEDFTPDGTTVAGSVFAAGAVAIPADNEEHFIRAVTVTTSDVASDPTESTSVTPLPASELEAGSVHAEHLASEIVLASTIIAGNEDDWRVELGGSEYPIRYWDGENTAFSLSKTGGDKANVFVSGRLEFGDGSRIEDDYIALQEISGEGRQTPKILQHGTEHVTDDEMSFGIPLEHVSSMVLLWVVTNGTLSGAPDGFDLAFDVDSTTFAVFVGDEFEKRYPTVTIPTEEDAANTAVWWMEISGAEAVDAGAWDWQVDDDGNPYTGTAEPEHDTGLWIASWFGVAYESGPKAKDFTNGFQDLFGTVFKGGEGWFGSNPPDGNQWVGIQTATKRVTDGGEAVSAAQDNSSFAYFYGSMVCLVGKPATGKPDLPPAGTARIYTSPRDGVATPHVVNDDGYIYSLSEHPKQPLSGDIWVTPKPDEATEVTVLLPKSYFDDAPIVTVTPQTAVPHKCSVGATSIERNQFNVVLTRTNDTRTILHWHAMERNEDG